MCSFENTTVVAKTTCTFKTAVERTQERKLEELLLGAAREGETGKLTALVRVIYATFTPSTKPLLWHVTLAQETVQSTVLPNCASFYYSKMQNYKMQNFQVFSNILPDF